LNIISTFCYFNIFNLYIFQRYFDAQVHWWWCTLRTLTVSCQCATLVSDLLCKCIMMGTNHLHAWTRTHAPYVSIRSFAAVHWIYFWNTLLKQRDWAQGAHQGPSTAARERSRAHSPQNTKINALLHCTWQNTGRKSFAKVEVKVFDGQNVVICCEESERDPVQSASLEERKRSNSLDKFRCWAK
jgi:hypothetical protein